MDLIFYVLLFLIAFAYASVGHGGASGYLALMAIFGFAPEMMKFNALVLNLGVSIISFSQFYDRKTFPWKMFLILVVASIPMAYLGGRIELDIDIYKRLLALCLIIPVLRLFFSPQIKVIEHPRIYPIALLILGLCIGLISGLIGIGGGILLSPVLLLLGWADLRQTAAISALFIFVNSASGLAGMSHYVDPNWYPMFWIFCIAILGGFAGSFAGAKRFNINYIKYMLGIVLTIAIYKLIFV